MIQDKRHVMSVVLGKLHSVKSSKTVTFSIDGHACPFAGSGASHVNRSAQRQHSNNDNEHDNDRIWWHDVVSVVDRGFGRVGNGGVDGLGVDDGRCMSDRGVSRVLGRSHIQPR